MAGCWCRLLCLAFLVAGGASDGQDELVEEVARLKDVVASLAQQTMMQQVYVEERTRSGGHSGLKQARANKDGTRAYQSSSHISHSLASMHDHADHYTTVGIGEFVAVLNGVEFRTRHNDYMLASPSKESETYREVSEMEFPEVPPAVLAKTSIEDQVEEMRAWFKAFADQDHSVRDYRKYFKPVMSYLEGMWVNASFNELDEPFESDRHHLNAKTLINLQEKIQFTSYTGSKDINENLAFLPTTIMNVDRETATPTYSQWTYRILSHQLSKDVPTSYFVQSGELHKRLTLKQTFRDYRDSRSVRFLINDHKRHEDYRYRWGVLESMMNEIPGLNNYMANIRDTSFDQDLNSPWNSANEPLNAGFYHRWYIQSKNDAMGSNMNSRGFSDRNMFVALTDHDEVTSVSAMNCKVRKGESEEECSRSEARVSWAIPMEIVYLTPLHRWNPYNIEMKVENAKEVKKGGRNGGFTEEKAFDGNYLKSFYRTPIEFFNGGEVDTDSADTAAGVVGVLDPDGNVRNVTASGVRIMLPHIPGIDGNIRTRYPIFPIHEEGSTVWKEIEALRIVMMDMASNLEYFENLPAFAGDTGGDGEEETQHEDTVMYTSTATMNPPGSHRHSVSFTYAQWIKLTIGKKALFVTTSKNSGHTHVIKVKYDQDKKQMMILRCDSKRTCWDGHELVLYES